MSKKALSAEKPLLTLGFFVITVAIIVAYLNPATGYEASIYLESPISFWVGFTFAMLVSIIIAFHSTDRSVRLLSIALMISAFMSVVLLPSIRGWFIVAGSDSLSHRGNVLRLISGEALGTDMLYPLVHLLSAVFYYVSGIEPGQNFHFIVSAFVLLFVAFVTLTVRLLSYDKWVVPIAALSAMFLLPINHVSGHMHLQPSSQTFLFISFVFFSVVHLSLSRDDRSAVVLSIALAAVILGHPQQAANLIILLGVFAAVQIAYTHLCIREQSSPSRPMFIPAGLLLLGFWVWVQATASELFGRNLARMISWVFIETQTAESVQTRGVSLEALGGSIEEMFIKLFIVSLVFSILSGLLFVHSLSNIFNRQFERVPGLTRSINANILEKDQIIVFWSLGFAASSGLFFMYLFAGFSDQYFRHFAFLMVTVSAFGAVFLTRLFRKLRNRYERKTGGHVVVILMSISLMLTLLIIFPSPYIFQGSDHVPEAQINGQETTFELAPEESSLASVREDPRRYVDAIYGNDPDTRDTTVEPGETTLDHFASEIPENGTNEEYHQDLRNYFNETSYLLITERNRVDEIGVYNGFRWSEDDFEYLQREPGINRVHDNGGIETYRIQPSDE